MSETLLTMYAEHGPKLVLYFFAALAWVAARFVRNNAYVNRALAELADAVTEVNQTYVDQLKRGRSPDSDGGSRLTDDEQAKAKRLAIEKAKSNIGAKGLKRLARILGVDVDRWLETKTESLVATIKTARAAATSPPAPAAVLTGVDRTVHSPR